VLRIGALGLGAGAFNLADLLRAEAAGPNAAEAAGSQPHKSVINIFLGGGPPHQDMFDLKPDAPREIRGEFEPIATNVPGIEICEVFPQLAKRMDKCAIIRTVVGATDRHDGFQCMTGWLPTELQSIGGRPSLGAVVTKLQGPTDPAVPPFVGLAEKTKEIRWSDSGKPGFLGAAFQAFKPDGQGMADMKLQELTIDRLRDRRDLLTCVDKLRRDVDASGMMKGMDAFGQRALDVLTSSKLLDALDLSQEDPQIVAKYGDGKPYNYQYDGAPTCNDHLLLARRLVEAGVRLAAVFQGGYDAHGNIEKSSNTIFPIFDQAFSALLEDLGQRGLLDSTLVLAIGEFGRTPHINHSAGRDHWPGVFSIAVAGAGIPPGQVIGSSDAQGGAPKERPISIEDLGATVYRKLGIDVHKEYHSNGRPVKMNDGGTPIRELF
jgi:hypothetical protein